MNKFRKSLTYGFNGLRDAWIEEANFRIELFFGVAVIASSLILGFSIIEISILFICVSMVLVTELINTVVEDICNKIQPNQDVDIGKIKDMASAALGVAAMFAGIIGLLVYSSHFNLL